jgi:hypothetical protein
MSKPIEFDTFRFPQLGTIIPKLGMCRDDMKPYLFGMIVLGFSTVVAGCATPPTFGGLCAIQPIAAQQGVMLAQVHCEKAE